MFSILTSFVGGIKVYLISGVIIALLLAGGWVYYKYSTAEMGKLQAQIVTVQQQYVAQKAATDALVADLKVVKAEQDKAAAVITVAQDAATKTATTIRATKYKKAAQTNSGTVTKQVNDDMTAAFKGISDATQ